MFLIRCIRTFGIRCGFRFWRLNRRLMREPQFRIFMAVSLAKEASTEPDPALADLLRVMSNGIVEYHERANT